MSAPESNSRAPLAEQRPSKVKSPVSLADVDIPEAELQVLHEIAAHAGRRQVGSKKSRSTGVMGQTSGVTALFAGPNGTAKTMAAEALAQQLERQLCRVDLSQVVNKYIGETEKNLDRVFHEAEASNATLFFDEGDALFGNRSAVKDSHDRYANIEINYLLQKMEAFRGVALLATNMADNIDPALRRRIAYVVQFPRPPAK